MDYVMGNFSDRRRFWVLNVIDEYSRRCLASVATKRPTSSQLLATLSQILEREGAPKSIRSDHGPQFISEACASWCWRHGVAHRFTGKIAFKENCLAERLNLTVRNEVIDVFHIPTLEDAQYVLDDWRNHYNSARSHKSLGGRCPDQIT